MEHSETHGYVTGGGTLRGTGIRLVIATALADTGAKVTIRGHRTDTLKAAASANLRLRPVAVTFNPLCPGYPGVEIVDRPTIQVADGQVA